MDSGFDFDTWAADALPLPPVVLAAVLRPDRARASRWSSATSSPRTRATSRASPRGRSGCSPRRPDAPLDLDPGEHRPRLARRPVRAACSTSVDETTGARLRPKRPLAGRYGFRWMTRGSPSSRTGGPSPSPPDTHRLDPGARAVFEAVRDDPTIRKVVLTRSRRFDLDGENVVALPIETREGQAQLAAAARSWSTGRRAAAIDLPMAKDAHHFVHVGSGLPIGPTAAGRCCAAAPARSSDLAADYRRLPRDAGGRPGRRAGQGGRHASQPAPLVDHRAAAARPGHPSPGRSCPTTCAAPKQALRDRLGGRRLVVLWPRPGRRPAARSTPAERDWLAAWCRRHDAVLGVREGAVDRAGSHTSCLMPHRGVEPVGPRSVPDPSVVLRVADAVVTDDADEAVDFLLTGRPLLHLAPGRRPTARRACSATIRPRAPCPGPVCRVFEELVGRARRRLRAPDAERRGGVSSAPSRLAFAHTDDLSGWRVVERIRRQYVDA